MKAFRNAIKNHLKTLHPRVYFQVAPDKAQYPYIVYDITSAVSDGEGLETYAVDIDGWDMPVGKGDTVQLENLMDKINKSLNKTTLTADEMAVTFYLDRKIPLIDDDKRILRRKYIYEARLFERS